MKAQNISDIYAANDKIREQTKQLVGNLSEAEQNFLPEGEKWSIAQIVEHMAIVQEGMTQISAKLLNKAQAAGKSSSGEARFSENFTVKAGEARKLKLEAPDQVRPKGDQTVADSLKRMDEARHKLEDLRPLFETIECTDFTFPHPFMGNLTAHEWLALVGGHEARHLQQISQRLNKSES